MAGNNRLKIKEWKGRQNEMKKNTLLIWTNLLLTAMIVLVLGISPGLAAPKKIPSKSAQKAALQQAAAAVTLIGVRYHWKPYGPNKDPALFRPVSELGQQPFYLARCDGDDYDSAELCRIRSDSHGHGGR